MLVSFVYKMPTPSVFFFFNRGILASSLVFLTRQAFLSLLLGFNEGFYTRVRDNEAHAANARYI